MQSNFITPGLFLNALRLEDAAFMLELVNTKGWISFIGERNIKTIEAAKEYIQKIIDNPYANYWVVSLKDEHTPIGIVTFIKREYLTYYDIGFAFLPEYSKKGYAFEATTAVLEKVSRDTSYTHILATTVKENSNSIKLLEKLGLRYESESQKENETLLLYSMRTEKYFINALTQAFFGIFTNSKGQSPGWEKITTLCIPETIIIKKAGQDENIYNLSTFIAPRKKMLSDGTLTEFEECELSETTVIIGNIAQRVSNYKKQGILNGKPFEGTGNKLFQFIKTNMGWKINSVTWEDEV